MSSKNMTVAVNVTVSPTVVDGVVTCLTATYQQGVTTPAPLPGTTVVDADGNIDLTKLDKNSGNYKDNTDISWTFTFQQPANGLIALLSPTTQSLVVQPGTGMQVKSNSATNVLELSDNGQANTSYGYAILALWQPLTTSPPSLFMLDPRIVNRT